MIAHRPRSATASRDNKIERMRQRYSSSNRQRCAKIGIAFILNMLFPTRKAEMETKRRKNSKELTEKWTLNSEQSANHSLSLCVYGVFTIYLHNSYTLCLVMRLSSRRSYILLVLSDGCPFIHTKWEWLFCDIRHWSNNMGGLCAIKNWKLLIHISEEHECRPATSIQNLISMQTISKVHAIAFACSQWFCSVVIASRA